MAKIVLGLGTAHTTQCSMTAEWWRKHGELDRKRTPWDELTKRDMPWLPAELTDEAMEKKIQRVESAITKLGTALKEAKPDILVIFGDDQHELFLDDGLPTFAVFMGEEIWDYPADLDKLPPSQRSAWWAYHGEQAEAYKGHPKLARHIVEQLVASDFDITRFARQPEGRTLGHAWTFVRRRIMAGMPQIPMVPVMINAYYAPNQPSAKRCFALGRAVRQAIESWGEDARVAVIGSGGLSHRVIDEKLDRHVIDALARNDAAALQALDRAEFLDGTAETLNWIATGGAMEKLRMELVDYVPGYRSIAGTGCGMTFARWQ